MTEKIINNLEELDIVLDRMFAPPIIYISPDWSGLKEGEIYQKGRRTYEVKNLEDGVSVEVGAQRGSPVHILIKDVDSFLKVYKESYQYDEKLSELGREAIKYISFGPEVNWLSIPDTVLRHAYMFSMFPK